MYERENKKMWMISLTIISKNLESKKEFFQIQLYESQELSITQWNKMKELKTSL